MSTKKELPAWFYRVDGLVYCGDILPDYFDEDISDLESENVPENDDASDSDGEYWCECGSEDEDCPHQAEEDEVKPENDDNDSERSFDGPEAEWYYKLKRLREDRKQELKRLRKEEKRELRSAAKEKQKAIEHDRCKAEEVRAAYEALKKAKREGETLHMGSLAGKWFELYSADHIEYIWPGTRLSRFVLFSLPHADSPMILQQAFKNGRRAVEGQIYLDGNAGCEFSLFRPPTRPRRRKHVLDCHCGKHELVFRFISDDHLILKVGRDMVFEGYEGPVPESAPEVFEFVGILCHERTERLERPRKKAKIWSEINHSI